MRTQTRMQLAMPYIHAHDTGCAVLQQTIGKATRRLTHVQAHFALYLQPAGG